MTTLRYENFIEGILHHDLTKTSSQILIGRDTVQKLPPLVENERIHFAIFGHGGEPEIVSCHRWDPSGTLYVERGQEGTYPQSWSAGAFVRLPVTKELLTSFHALLDDIRGNGSNGPVQEYYETLLETKDQVEDQYEEIKALREKFVYYLDTTQHGVRIAFGSGAIISHQDTPYPSATVELPE